MVQQKVAYSNPPNSSRFVRDAKNPGANHYLEVVNIGYRTLRSNPGVNHYLGGGQRELLGGLL